MSAHAPPGSTPAAAPEVLRLTGITKRFGDLVANEEIGLSLRRGEIVALLGENGAGKTTLMNILFGHYVADSGDIQVAAHAGQTGKPSTLRALPPGSPQAALEAGIGMVHQHFTLADNMTALDNIVLGTQPLWRPWQARAAARRKLDALMRRSGLTVDLDARVVALTVGERQRVEILKALFRDARILILDEPTAVLTPQEVDGLFEVLRALAAEGLAVVFISHKLNEVLAVSERVVVLRQGRKVAEMPTAGANRRSLAEAMVGRELPENQRPPHNPGAPVVRLEGIEAPGELGRAGLHNASLTLHSGEIVGIAGVSGNGQAALSALLSGLARPTAGHLFLLGEEISHPSVRGFVDAGVGRIPEDRHRDGVVDDMEVWENLIIEDLRDPDLQSAGFIRKDKVMARADALIAENDIRCPGPETRTRLLSGGNMQKLILARVLERHPRFILANQPTRGLDIGAVTYVHGRLLQACAEGAGILLISEDLDELLTLSDRVAVLYRGQLSQAMATAELDIRGLGLMMAGHSAAEQDAGGPHAS